MLGFFNLFTRTRPVQSRPSPRRSPRLWLERLETRDCPSAPGGSLGGPPAPSAPAPVVTISLTMNGLKSVTLTGSVAADNPAGLTVTFVGALSALTTTDANGNYTLTVNADTLGTVQASTVDDLGQTSNTATASVVDNAPLIVNFYCSRSADVVTFYGKVIDRDAFGMVVTVQGSPGPLHQGVTDTANASGVFMVIVGLTEAQIGSVGATCVDCWGQQSNLALTYVS